MNNSIIIRTIIEGAIGWVLLAALLCVMKDISFVQALFAPSGGNGLLLFYSVLLKASVLGDGFIHADFPSADLERRQPDLDRERVRNADHLRGDDTLSGHLAEGRVHRIQGQIRGGRYQPLCRSHLVQLFIRDQKAHELVCHIQIIAGLVDGKLHGRAVDKVSAFICQGDRREGVAEGRRMYSPAAGSISLASLSASGSRASAAAISG